MRRRVQVYRACKGLGYITVWGDDELFGVSVYRCGDCRGTGIVQELCKTGSQSTPGASLAPVPNRSQPLQPPTVS